jgi:hypothetical protein
MTTGIKFDRSFNLGHVLTIVALLGGGFTAWSGVQSNLKNLDGRVASLELAAAAYTNLTTRVTILETTVGNVEATLSRIYTEAQETNARLTQVQVDLTGVAARLRNETGAREPVPF